MKKKIKALIIATSIAAIAGIAAVSFAAWNGSSFTKEATGGLGHITTDGTDALVVTDLNTEDTKLVPYDQVFGYESGMTLNHKFKVEYKFNEEGALDPDNYTYSLQLTECKNSEGAAHHLQLFIHIDESGVYNTSSFTGVADTNWLALETKTAGEEGEDPTYANPKIDLELNEDNSCTQYLYVVLVSEDEADMDATYTITVTATPVNTAATTD